MEQVDGPLVTCVCDESVGAEAHAVRQVGGELFRPEPQTPVVTERCFRGSLAVAVAAPWLRLQDKYSTWRQALIGSFE